MKPNSCVFRAVAKIAGLYGVNITSDVFDKYNNGNGINTFLMPAIIDEALNPYGVGVSKILVESIKGYKSIDDVKSNVPDFTLPEKLCFSGSIDSYAVLLTKEEDHVEAFTGNECFGAVKMAIFIDIL